MRILMAGDTHGDLHHLRYLLTVAKEQKCDRIFVLGDFGWWAHMSWGVSFLEQLDLSANLKNIHIYWLDGNHDKISHLYKHYSDPQYLDPEGFIKTHPYLHYAPRGHRWTWDDVRFIACGGAYSIDKEYRLIQEGNTGRGTQWFPEEQMSDREMDRILENREPVDVLLAHDMPKGANPGWHRKSPLECEENQNRLQRAIQVLDPSLYLHGHLHWPYEHEMFYSHEGPTRDMRSVKVVGLDCNGNAAQWPGYKREASWMVLDTADIKIQGGVDASNYL
jgi:predicted phosphodiesterase